MPSLVENMNYHRTRVTSDMGLPEAHGYRLCKDSLTVEAFKVLIWVVFFSEASAEELQLTIALHSLKLSRDPLTLEFDPEWTAKASEIY